MFKKFIENITNRLIFEDIPHERPVTKSEREPETDNPELTNPSDQTEKAEAEAWSKLDTSKKLLDPAKAGFNMEDDYWNEFSRRRGAALLDLPETATWEKIRETAGKKWETSLEHDTDIDDYWDKITQLSDAPSGGQKQFIADLRELAFAPGERQLMEAVAVAQQEIKKDQRIVGALIAAAGGKRFYAEIAKLGLDPKTATGKQIFEALDAKDQRDKRQPKTKD